MNQVLLTEQETQRYDRQIRVWGAEAQSKIQSSKVLLCGLRGLNIEVVKNLVLAGVNVTIQESSEFLESDQSYCFLCGATSIGKKFANEVHGAIQQLNKFATVEVNTLKLQDLSDSYFDQFTAIVLSKCSDEDAIRVNKICRKSTPQKQFFWSDTYGFEACFISDFGDNFQYKNDPPNDKEYHQISFKSIEYILSKKLNELPSKFFPLNKTYTKFRMLQKLRGDVSSVNNEDKLSSHLKDFLQYNEIDSSFLTIDEVMSCVHLSDSVLVTTCSVIGSFLSQEIIKGISKVGVPLYSVVVYDSDEYTVKVFPVN